ncbi:MAG: septum formation initiator family protein [Alphaproteobacteria bacterium]|jgi:cell division protein FtsB
MVVRTRFHRILQAVGLYCLAAAAIGYFGFHAYHGDHGIQANQRFQAEARALKVELAALKRERSEVERRVVLLRASGLDPDMLDQRARELLNFAGPHDLVLVEPRR